MQNMAAPVLSIVIPTYNRSAQLALLLADTQAVLQTHHGQIQVVICDNHSTDGSPALIEAFRTRWPAAVQVVSRPVNLGMEGNIACAMLEGIGRYIWTVSDHQRLCVSAVQRAVDLMSHLNFDIGHAKLVQWSPALAQDETVMVWSDVPGRQQGAFLFSLGNLSTLIYKRELVTASIKSVFRACVWSYPHLGVISSMRADTHVVEFKDMSALPEGKSGSALVHDYDKLSVRFRANILCVDQLTSAVGLPFDRRGFFTADYRAAFKAEVLNFLVQPAVTMVRAWTTLWPIIVANQGAPRWLAIFVLSAASLTPNGLRVGVATAVRNWVVSRRRRASAGT